MMKNDTYFWLNKEKLSSILKGVCSTANSKFVVTF